MFDWGEQRLVQGGTCFEGQVVEEFGDEETAEESFCCFMIEFVVAIGLVAKSGWDNLDAAEPFV